VTARPARISVVMPARNAADTIAEAVDSILGQTFQDLELVVIDDASTDGTADILRSFDDPRLRVVVNAEWQGLVRSLNDGVAVAGADLIARLDADDVAAPRRLEREHAVLTDDPRVGLVATGYRMVEPGVADIVVGMPADHASLWFELLFGNCILHSSVVFRRTVFDAVGGYREECFPAEDYDLWLRMVEVTNVATVRFPQVTYRRSPAATSSTLTDEMIAKGVAAGTAAVTRLTGRAASPRIVEGLGVNGLGLTSRDFSAAFTLCLEARRAVVRECRARAIPVGDTTASLARLAARGGLRGPSGRWSPRALAWLTARHPVEAARLFSYRRRLG
jgi:hypothetical protein